MCFFLPLLSVLWPLSESGFRWKGPPRLSSFSVIVMLLLGQPAASGPVCGGDLLRTTLRAPVLAVRSARPPQPAAWFARSPAPVGSQCVGAGGRRVEHSEFAVGAVPFGVRSLRAGFCFIFDVTLHQFQRKEMCGGRRIWFRE